MRRRAARLGKERGDFCDGIHLALQCNLDSAPGDYHRALLPWRGPRCFEKKEPRGIPRLVKVRSAQPSWIKNFASGREGMAPLIDDESEAAPSSVFLLGNEVAAYL